MKLMVIDGNSLVPPARGIGFPLAAAAGGCG